MKEKKQRGPRNRADDGSRHVRLKRPREPLFGAFRNEVAAVSAPQLQLQGMNALFIEDCQSVLSYDDNLVKLLLKGMTLTVLGADLTVSDFTASTFTIRGSIRSLELEPVSVRREAGERGNKR